MAEQENIALVLGNKSVLIKVAKAEAQRIKQDSSYAAKVLHALMQAGELMGPADEGAAPIAGDKMEESKEVGNFAEIEKTHGDEDSSQWTSKMTYLLIDERRYFSEKFDNPLIRKKKIWAEIAANVNSVTKAELTSEACSIKWRGLLQRYRKIKNKFGETNSKNLTWKYFNEMNELLRGDAATQLPKERLLSQMGVISTPTSATASEWSSKMIHILIAERRKFCAHFNSPLIRKKKIWAEIAANINRVTNADVTSEDCGIKWRGLLQRYRRIKEKVEKTGSDNDVTWAYFNIMDDLLGSDVVPQPSEDNLLGLGSESMPTSTTPSEWSSQMIHLLIDERRKLSAQFDNPLIQKKKIWVEIAENISRVANADITSHACSIKWRGLLHRYRKIKDRQIRKTGSRKVTWKYLDDMDELVRDGVLTQPLEEISPSTTGSPTPNTLCTADLLDTSSEEAFEMPINSHMQSTCKAIQVETSENRKRKAEELPGWLEAYMREKRIFSKIKQENAKIQWEELKELKRQKIEVEQQKVEALKLLTETLVKLVQR